MHIREDVLKAISQLAVTVCALVFGAASLAAGNSSVSLSSDDITNATIYGSYGYMLGEAIEVEIQVGQNGSSRYSSTTVGATAKYYFTRVGEAGSYSPYLKAGLRANFDNFDGRTEKGCGVLGGGGFDYALTGSVATFLEGTYSRVKYRDRFDRKVGLFEVNVGLRLRF
jgi:hypothetical protein